MAADHRTTTSTRIHLDLALALLDAARTEAAATDLHIALAVVDPAGVIILSARAGEANFAALEVATDKAYTAAAWRAPTSAWAELTTPGAPGWGMAGSLSGRAVVLAGGVPIWDENGQFLGGLGVSGGLPHQDEAVAGRALTACGLTAAPPTG